MKNNSESVRRVGVLGSFKDTYKASRTFSMEISTPRLYSGLGLRVHTTL